MHRDWGFRLYALCLTTYGFLVLPYVFTPYALRSHDSRLTVFIGG
jgi:hypothetical protein